MDNYPPGFSPKMTEPQIIKDDNSSFGDVSVTFHLKGSFQGVSVYKREGQAVEVNWYGKNSTIEEAETLAQLLAQAMKFAKSLT